MHSVGIFEAKSQLSALIERVARGEEVLLTRHGKPVARLVAPGAPTDAAALAEWAAELRTFRRNVDRGARPGATLPELIAAGRR